MVIVFHNVAIFDSWYCYGCGMHLLSFEHILHNRIEQMLAMTYYQTIFLLKVSFFTLFNSISSQLENLIALIVANITLLLFFLHVFFHIFYFICFRFSCTIYQPQSTTDDSTLLRSFYYLSSSLVFYFFFIFSFIFAFCFKIYRNTHWRSRFSQM